MKKAVIFDMDGVISDTQKFHALAEHILLKELGIDISPSQITQKYAGVNDESMFREIFKNHNQSKFNITSLIDKKWALMTEISKDKIKPITGSLELIDNLRSNGHKLALASASTLDFINHVLIELKITENFATIVSATQVKEGKPAPDVFILAAKNIEMPAKECIVIEDGESGMLAAKRAKMKCVGLVKNAHNQTPADINVTSLTQLSSDFLQSL